MGQGSQGTTQVIWIAATAAGLALLPWYAVEGARWATVGLFISPNFLYRPELGATTNGTLRLTAYEIASRLSFLVWGSVPDKTTELAHAFETRNPLGRPGDLSDIEGPAAYLASDASKFQTGDILVIDGGRLVKNL